MVNFFALLFAKIFLSFHDPAFGLKLFQVLQQVPDEVSELVEAQGALRLLFLTKISGPQLQLLRGWEDASEVTYRNLTNNQKLY